MLSIAFLAVLTVVVPQLVDPVQSVTPMGFPSPTPTPAQVICAGDANGDGHVGIDEVLRVVRRSLHGCP